MLGAGSWRSGESRSATHVEDAPASAEVEIRLDAAHTARERFASVDHRVQLA